MHRTHLQYVGLTAALIATGILGCERELRTPAESDKRTAQVSLFNATHDVLPLRLQSLNSDYVVDCELVSDDPSRFLSDDHLTSPIRAELLSGIEQPLSYNETSEPGGGAVTNACRFSFIVPDDDRLSRIAAGWPRDLAEKEFYTDVDAPPDLQPESNTLVAEAVYDDVDDDDLRPWRHRPCGGTLSNCSDTELEELITPPPGAAYHWSAIGDYPVYHHWEARLLEQMPIADPEGDQCRSGRDATPLTWETLPPGSWRVMGVEEFILAVDEEANDESGDDNAEVEWTCYEVSLQDDFQYEEEWTFCGSPRLAERLDSEWSDGLIYVEFFTEQRYDSPPSAYETLMIDIERRTQDEERYEVETIELVRGHGIPEHIGLDWETEAVTECGARREVPGCEQVIVPTGLTVGTDAGDLEVRPGETVDLDPLSEQSLDHRRRFEFVRGMHRAVSDLRCQDQRIGPPNLRHAGAYVEFVYYGGISIIDN